MIFRELKQKIVPHFLRDVAIAYNKNLRIFETLQCSRNDFAQEGGKMIVCIPLKKLREAAGMSQNDLARNTGYSSQFIQKIEQNKVKSITFEAAGRFCDALGCKPRDLLEEGDLPKLPKIETKLVEGLEAKVKVAT